MVLFDVSIVNITLPSTEKGSAYHPVRRNESCA
jgi:hypothetical protein